MGTRSLTHIIDNDFDRDEHLCTIYRQYDGYPEGHGRDLVDFITSRKFVNGISGDPTEVFNGAGCFAAALVAYLKTQCNGQRDAIEAGGVYLHPPTTENPEEYNYTVTISGPEVALLIETYTGDVIFEGSPTEFVPLLEERR